MRRMFSENQIKGLSKEFLESGEDINIGGNLNVNGILNVKDYELDEDITISNLPTGIEAYYAHARISNGKLNIVLALKMAQNGLSEQSQVSIGAFEVSEEVFSKLYPYSGNAIATKAEPLVSSAGVSAAMINIQIVKDTGNLITLKYYNPAISGVGSGWTCRFEFNFILS